MNADDVSLTIFFILQQKPKRIRPRELRIPEKPNNGSQLSALTLDNRYGELTEVGGHLVHLHVGEPGVDAHLPLLEDLPVRLSLVLLV